MDAGEECLQGATVEHGPEQLEFLVVVAQPVTMCQIELLAIELHGHRFAVEDDTALAREVVAAPDVMVPDEEMHLYTHVGQFGELAEKAGVAFGYHQSEFVPEVKHITQQIYGCSFVLDAVEEIDHSALLSAAVRYGS